MKRSLLILALLILLAAAPQLPVPAVGPAAPQAAYTLSRWTVDGGGASLHQGSYQLDATLGQPDAQVWGDGRYRLSGGFWTGRLPSGRIYLPLVTAE